MVRALALVVAALLVVQLWLIRGVRREVALMRAETLVSLDSLHETLSPGSSTRSTGHEPADRHHDAMAR
jgi:hypothetical protein